MVKKSVVKHKKSCSVFHLLTAFLLPSATQPFTKQKTPILMRTIMDFVSNERLNFFSFIMVAFLLFSYPVLYVEHFFSTRRGFYSWVK